MENARREVDLALVQKMIDTKCAMARSIKECKTTPIPYQTSPGSCKTGGLLTFEDGKFFIYGVIPD